MYFDDYSILNVFNKKGKKWNPVEGALQCKQNIFKYFIRGLCIAVRKKYLNNNNLIFHNL